MKLTYDVTPRIFRAPTKDELEHHIRSIYKSSFCSSTNGTGMKVDGFSSDKMVMINYEKFRSKRGVRKAHWIAYVYLFDVDLLKALNIKVIQHKRNFTIEKRS